MKFIHLVVIAVIIIAGLSIPTYHLRASSPASEPTRRFEYTTIRWAGIDNTHVIRPSGEVEFVGTQLTKVNKPNRADNRSFYLNLVMNGLAKEGYEFAGISNDDIIMKRAVTR